MFRTSLFISKGERRIRVHTLCLPVVASISDVMHSADQQCIVGLLSKMGELNLRTINPYAAQRKSIIINYWC